MKSAVLRDNKPVSSFLQIISTIDFIHKSNSNHSKPFAKQERFPILTALFNVHKCTWIQQNKTVISEGFLQTLSSLD